MITYILDKIRMALGDSNCPLCERCPGYDKVNDCCVSYRGRNEIGGERAECYNLFKPRIRAERVGLLEKIFERITEGIMKAEGFEEEDLG